MFFVPVVPPTPTQPPSPRTRELAGLLAKVLDEYTRAHPDTRSAEIRAAVRLALRSTAPGTAGTRALLSLSLGIGVAVLLLGLVMFRTSGELDLGSGFPIIAVAIVLFLLMVVVLVKARSS